jgi:hypothetical protein
MAYGDNRPSPTQRNLAIAAILLAMLELGYSWLVSGMMASVPNPSLMAISSLLVVVVAGNAVLIFGAAHPAKHWLRILCASSVFVMIGMPTALLLYVMARVGS